MPVEPSPRSPSTLHRPEVRAVLDRLHRSARGDIARIVPKIPAFARSLLRGQKFFDALTPALAQDIYMPVSREQGKLLYLVARSLGATRVVEFGTSFGISAVYLAAAVKDNGGGLLIGTEIEPSKHQKATANLAEAGLSAVAEVRLGDALVTLRDAPEPIDLVLLDGWKDLYLPVLELLKPKLRRGAVVMGDNIHLFKKALTPYVEYMQSGANGFQSVTLSVADGFEYSYYDGPRG